MKKYLNRNNAFLKEYLKEREETVDNNTSVYDEESDPRPVGVTRMWISYDITDEYAPDSCRDNLEEWILAQNSESFGASVATFSINRCLSNDEEVAKWLNKELVDAEVLNKEDILSQYKTYLSTPGISIYVIYRNSDAQGETLRSGHFVLIQNSTITHFGD